MTVADNEFYQAFGRMEGKIDILLQQMPALESRVRSLENWKWMIVGGSAVISAIVAFLVRVLG